jgi:hypothetical protein
MVLTLLRGMYSFTLHIEDDTQTENKEPEWGEDATQLDLDALEDYERKKNGSKPKR